MGSLGNWKSYGPILIPGPTSVGGKGISIYEGYQTVVEGLEFTIAQRIADVHNRSVDEGELAVSISDIGIE
ncbi:MAG: hypothetical protein DWQ01_08715 [Planctomycetota bacterium]|nr:MAG: hypothetical protein DWQ01_08715 [Planctomycetota bacterium]